MMPNSSLKIPQKILIITVLLAIFLNGYKSMIPGILLGELLLIFACLLILLQNRFTIVINSKLRPLLLFFFVGLITSIFSIITQNSSFIQVPLLEVISRLIRYATYIFFITIVAMAFDFEFALKYYRLFCIILSIYILFQFSLYYGFHIMLPVKILPFEWARTYDLEAFLSSMNSGYFRAYGVFLEPGYAAKFLLPGFALALFGWTKKKQPDVCTLVLIGMAIILTTSLQGIIVAFFTFVIWNLWKKPKLTRESIHRIKNMLLIVIALGVIFVVLNSFGLFENVLMRFENISYIYKEGGSGSTALRLFRGWSVFAALPVMYKLLGTGYGNLSNFIYDNSIITKYDHYLNTVTAMEYTDGISGILISTGIIGFILFCKWFIKLIKKTNGAKKMILLQLIILLFAGSGLLTPTGIFYMGFVYSKNEFKENGEHE